MRTLFLAIALIGVEFLTGSAFAVPVAIQRRDIKFPTQQMVEKQSFTNPIASNDSTLKSAFAGPTSAAAVTLSSFLASVDVARDITVTPGGTTGDIETCQVTINGTNYFGSTMTEGLNFAANATGKLTTAGAFKTVTSVVWAANCESGAFAATWSIGQGEKLGLSHCVANAGDFFFSLFNGAKEATAPTLTVNASAVSLNTSDFNGAMQGSNDFVLFYMQNYGCFAP